MNILVTGGAGFIGSAFVRLLVRDGFLDSSAFATKRTVHKIIVVDKLSYAGDLTRLKEVEGRYRFYRADICNGKKIRKIFCQERPQLVVHFAAETHVDRSIKNAKEFLKTNILGTEVLLDVSRHYKARRFCQVSTDEVYGDIKQGAFAEDSPILPSSPYAASKAAADLLVKSYIRTYNFPAIIIRPSNNYGPWQYPEKLLPRAILKVFLRQRIPLYGKGKNVREWLYVEDCARGILAVLKKGRIGEVYNLGSSQEQQNIAIIQLLLRIMRWDKSQIEFVKDRPGHDIRYRLNSQKITKETGWRPEVCLEEGLRKTIRWAIGQRCWLEAKAREVARLYGEK